MQTSEKEMLRKELAGAGRGDDARLAAASEEVVYKIDIPANRYDMLCLEGIARALNIFTGRQAVPQYTLADVPGARAAGACGAGWGGWALRRGTPRGLRPLLPTAPTPNPCRGQAGAHRRPARGRAGPPLHRWRRPAGPEVRRLPLQLVHRPAGTGEWGLGVVRGRAVRVGGCAWAAAPSVRPSRPAHPHAAPSPPAPTRTHPRPPAPARTRPHPPPPSQDRLHQNLCRQRSLVAIGTHDLSAVRAPLTYEALPPAAVRFVPLKQDREWAADELLAHYAAHDLKLKRYVPLIQGSVVVPVVLDADRRVLSLPPVINGAASAISLATTDVLIECTGTDLAKARTVLATVVAMFCEHAAVPFQAEPVDVVDALGQTHSAHWVGRGVGLAQSSAARVAEAPPLATPCPPPPPPPPPPSPPSSLP